MLAGIRAEDDSMASVHVGLRRLAIICLNLLCRSERHDLRVQYYHDTILDRFYCFQLCRVGVCIFLISGVVRSYEAGRFGALEGI